MKPLLALIFATISMPLIAAEKPNFIFILSDDIAQGDLGSYGQKIIQTPNLDRLAAEGTRYMQAYCGTTVCAPCRTSFFTGLHSGNSPVRGNYEVSPEGQYPLPDETVTIAEVAKNAGYATSTFGKWGMGNFESTGAPAKQGVDRFFGYNCQRHAHSYFPTYLLFGSGFSLQHSRIFRSQWHGSPACLFCSAGGVRRREIPWSGGHSFVDYGDEITEPGGIRDFRFQK